MKVHLIVESDKNIDIARALKKTFSDNLEVRYFAENTSGTLRNYVFGKELALNGIKILAESGDEPSYIGTAYVSIDDIETLNDKFESLWGLAKPMKEKPKE